MMSTQERMKIKNTLEKTTRGLAQFLYFGLKQKLEPIRLARAGYALLTSGCSTKGSFPEDSLSTYLVRNQQGDGGWVDVEETLWCLGYLSAFGERYYKEATNGKKWLSLVRLLCKAWGTSSRDQPRIPITSLATVLTPEIVDDATLNWLAQQWQEDLNSTTQLTYKGAFFLLASAHTEAHYDKKLINRTIEYLTTEQEVDGGYGPWKGHPVGCDPWSTGIVLWGLSKVQEKVPKETIERALSWLNSKQLDNGMWPYHYLDDGTSMALLGTASNLYILME